MKLIKVKFLVGIIFMVSILSIPSFSFAEMQIEIQEGEINVETNPNNPQPYEDVTINITSYATDLNKAVITWQKESSTVLSGIGKTSYSFKASGPNTTTIFNVIIQPTGSISAITKRIVIAPSEIEMMWEALDGYTPPFYKGKSLPISGGRVKVVAIPNTNTIKSGNGSISYTWKNNDNTALDASGYNKNSYIYKNSMFDTSNNINVIASSVDGSYGAESTIEIPTYSPKIVFYKKSPTEGILYNVALDKEAIMTEDEMTIVAAPYFLPIEGNEGDFTYEWKINDTIINTPSKKTELTIRPTSRGGFATIDLTMENINELFQKISNRLKLSI